MLKYLFKKSLIPDFGNHDLDLSLLGVQVFG